MVMIAAGSGAAAEPEKKEAVAEPEKVVQPLPLPDLRHRGHRG